MSYRAYECAYLHTIPIVLENPIWKTAHLPVVVFNNYNMLRTFGEGDYFDWSQFLDLTDSINWNIPELDLDFWRRKADEDEKTVHN